MSSDICEGCGNSKDICVCKTPAPVDESVDENAIRCAECNELFIPINPELTLCPDCSNKGVEVEQPELKLSPQEITQEDVGKTEEVLSPTVEKVEPVVKEAIPVVVSTPELVVGHPDPVPQSKDVEVSVSTNDNKTATFSVIPEVKVPEPTKTTIPIPDNITLKTRSTILDDKAMKTDEDIFLGEYFRNPATLEVVLKGINNDTGKPVLIHLDDVFAQKLIRELMPREDKRMQVLLDRMHKIRETRGLAVEKLDKDLTDLMASAKSEFMNCKTGTDVKKVEAYIRASLAVINQKRYLAKFSIHEESELSLQLAKLQHGDDDSE